MSTLFLRLMVHFLAPSLCLAGMDQGRSSCTQCGRPYLYCRCPIGGAR